MNIDKPCIVQRDRTILLEAGHKDFAAAREQLAHYAELVKSPESFHTYRITPLSLWNAAAAGWSVQQLHESLASLSRWEVPSGLLHEAAELMSRYGRLSLYRHPDQPGMLVLEAKEEELMSKLCRYPSLASAGYRAVSASRAEIPAERRGLLKQELTRLGYPVLDLAGYHDGQPLSFRWRGEQGAEHGEREPKPQAGEEGDIRVFQLREYQKDAAAAFRDKEGRGGSGVLVLPCGAGKTVIGMAVMRELQCETLILTSNATSVRQWAAELSDKTTLSPFEIGEYSGQRKEVRPVTVATYQILTHRHSKDDELRHMKLFNERNWGLIIYDEVHLLPAPVFRATADIQATRRLGLTAALVREDGREQDVFSLIGPKRYEMPWKVLEEAGWIASAECVEIKVPMSEKLAEAHGLSGSKEQYRLASENPAKLGIIKQLLSIHASEQTLVIGHYLNQLKVISKELGIPLITGETGQEKRQELYGAFKRGEVKVIAVSKVANFAVDLPDASVAIEVSGTFGSRQEEAQRLGRILRPKAGGNRAYFYTLVSKDSREEGFALRRRMFLIQQGYRFRVDSGIGSLQNELSLPPAASHGKAADLR